MLGLAIGDALGATVEFSRRDSTPVVTDLVGGGGGTVQRVKRAMAGGLESA